MDSGVVVISDLRRRELDRAGTTVIRVQFADRVRACFNMVVVFYQSRSIRYPAGYFAVATLLNAEVSAHDARFLNLTFSTLRYLPQVVTVQAGGPIIERSARQLDGTLNGRRFAEDFRLLAEDEFDEIVGQSFFPQDHHVYEARGLDETSDGKRERVERETWLRTTLARSLALPIYKYRCAISGQQMLSRDGRTTGLHVCHVTSVAFGGFDVAANLVLFCPDFHTRYDTGTIDILDDYTWVPIGNNQDDVVRNWQGPRQLFVPDKAEHRLNREYLAAHRLEMLRRYGG